MKNQFFHCLKTTIPAVGSGGRVRPGGWVRWLDKGVIMLNSVQLSWKLTELGNYKFDAPPSPTFKEFKFKS